MLISLLCVFITTVLLIQNIPACIMVLICVVLTLVRPSPNSRPKKSKALKN